MSGSRQQLLQPKQASESGNKQQVLQPSKLCSDPSVPAQALSQADALTGHTAIQQGDVSPGLLPSCKLEAGL